MQNFKIIKNNQGIALFIALIFLFISTLLGISSLQNNLLSEKMSLNSILREKALEAAEATLLEGEDFVQTFATQIRDAVVAGTGTGRTARTISINCEASVQSSGGICAPVKATLNSATHYEHWVDVTSGGSLTSINAWTNAARHRRASDEIRTRYDLNTAPKYIIEFLGHAPNSDGSTGCVAGAVGVSPAENDQWPYCSIDPLQFRITALATSGNYDETRVMLQTTYRVD